MPATLRLFVFLTAITVALGSCDTIKDYGDQALSLVGLGSQEGVKPVKKSAKKIRPPRDKKRPGAKPDTVKTSATDDDTDIVITKTEENKTRKVKKKDLKSAEKPEFRVEAPVDVQKRVGGAARFILDDGEYIYLDFPQHFAVYDRELNFLARIPIAFPLKKVARFEAKGGTYLYLKEEKDVLEIIELTKNITEQGETYELKDVVSYEVGGDFHWIDAKTLVIFLKDKLQFLDFSDFEQIRILNEAPVAEVTGAYAVDKYLYLSRKGFLEIMDTGSYKILSSLRIGRDFGFLKPVVKGDETLLALSLTGKDGALNGIQYLNLTKDRSSVTDLGEVILLEQPLINDHIDFDNSLVLGEEAGERQEDGHNPVRLFSLAEKRFLRGELSAKTKLMAWSLASGRVYLVNPLEISINRLSLDEAVIRMPVTPKSFAGSPVPTPLANPSPTPRPAYPPPARPLPLAQIGAVKTMKDEYSLKPEKTIEFMADARKVAMLDENHFIVFEYRVRLGRHQVFTSSNFKEDDFSLAESVVTPPAVFNRLMTTDIGLFAYAEQTENIYYMDVGLAALNVFPVKPGKLVSWTHFTSPADLEIFVTTSVNDRDTAPVKTAPAPVKSAPPKPHEKPKEEDTDSSEPSIQNKIPLPTTPVLTDGDYVMLLHHLKSPTDIEVLSSTYFNEKPFALRTMDNELMILTGSGIRFYGIEDMRKPIMNDIDRIDFPVKYDIVAVKPFLVNNRVYALILDNNRFKILIFSILHPEEHVILGDFDITGEQFDGASFSKGGQLFMLPTTEGTLFYDMTELKEMEEDKRIVAHWDLPSESVDVADNGRYVCVALGAMGVYCGDLLFY